MNADVPSAQPSLTLSCGLGDGFSPYFRTWWQIAPFDGGFTTDVAAEGDFIVGVYREPPDGGIYFDASVSYFDIPPLATFGEDTIQPALEVGRQFEINDWWRIAPYARGEWAIPLEGDQNYNIFLGARQTFELGLGDDLEFKANAYVARTSEPTGFIGHTRLRLDVPIGDNVTVGPLLRFSAPLSDFDDGRGFEVVGGGRVVFSF